MPYSEFLTRQLTEVSGLCVRAARIEQDYATANNGKPCYPSMVGALGAIAGSIAISARSASEWTADHIVPAEREAERLMAILEGLDIDLNEESLSALEAMIKNQDEYRSEIRALSGAFQKAVCETQVTERELEQQNATEALTAAGFVLNDEDGETWQNDSLNLRVTIELTNGHESRYKWEVAGCEQNQYAHVDSGVSGEFHRLLALIGTEVKS